MPVEARLKDQPTMYPERGCVDYVACFVTGNERDTYHKWCERNDFPPDNIFSLNSFLAKEGYFLGAPYSSRDGYPLNDVEIRVTIEYLKDSRDPAIIFVEADWWEGEEEISHCIYWSGTCIYSSGPKNEEVFDDFSEYKILDWYPLTEYPEREEMFEDSFVSRESERNLGKKII